MNNNNILYDYNVFINEISKYINNEDSNVKIINAIKDTVDALNSTNKLNKDEINVYFQVMFTALGLAQIK